MVGTGRGRRKIDVLARAPGRMTCQLNSRSQVVRHRAMLSTLSRLADWGNPMDNCSRV